MKKYPKILINNGIFLISAILLLSGSIFIFIYTEYFYDLIESVSLWVRNYFGQFYLVTGLLCVIILLILAFSKFGKKRLGAPKPEFDQLSWIAMLYSAGMGAGILLRAVQEPVFMFLNPPIETGASPESISLEYTFYQWGFTAWAFYGLFAVVLAYSIFIQQKKVQLGKATEGLKKVRYLPESIDILTILTTVIGLVAAIGLGTTQIEGGISHFMSREPGSLITNMMLVFLICFLAFISAWSGVNRGIKRISNWNIYLAVFLMLFVFFQADISGILQNFFKSLYFYVRDFIPLSLAMGNYDPGKAFLTDWTYYYWAFWLAWAPFTGIFIARISKGRTIREMIIGVLLIPSLGSFFWFSVFGHSAFKFIENLEEYHSEFGNVFTSIFVFLEAYPFSGIIALLVILLLISFLVTSVDSAIFVLSMFTDGGRQEPRKRFRLAWAVIICIFCEAIIVLGQVKPTSNVLTAMQKLLIITSLPFAFFTIYLMLVMLKRLFKKR
ncbi:glycine/betaine ABC transporter [Christiangramia fulva]|uniref:Glycine/betaine ABC transporter n=1 Tax=Christiangramia fulva TaxID=2126553 RepID=A0A2R3Z1J5_9FLAO|nr:BCCT family transporter [Christiangramia fulva]AVR44118.1 glycine/betaine ABC transporter [Christiangramia fulva]